jgi:uncharacterized membrane protein
VAVVAVAVGAVASAGEPSLRALDFFPAAVSADGTVVVGNRQGEAIRWTAAGGAVGLGTHPAAFVSADGSIIVGGADRWTVEQGWVPLEGLPAEMNFIASGISADGSVVVGSVISGGGGGGPCGPFGDWYCEPEPLSAMGIRWSGGTWTWMSQEDFPNDLANAVSADGLVVVGSSSIGVWRWTTRTGMVGLGHLSEVTREFATIPTAVSLDGSMIVGESGGKPFRWTHADGMAGLDALPGLATLPTEISADGSMIIGGGRRPSCFSFGGRVPYCNPNTPLSPAVIWEADGDVRTLSALLGDLGLEMSGWELSEANDISADGFTIVGSGIDPSGQSVGWIATIPEASMIPLFGLATVLLYRRRRAIPSIIGRMILAAVSVGVMVPAPPAAAAQFDLVATHPDAAAQGTATGRMISTLKPFNGKLYAGFGDYEPQNTGPIGIRAFDPALDRFTDQLLTRPQPPHGAETNAVLMFREIGGKLYATHIDPWPDPFVAGEMGGFSMGVANGATDTWSDHRIVEGIHIFDIATFDGTDLWLVGSNGSNGVVWRKRNEASNWEVSLVVPPQRTGIGARFYAIHAYNGKLYTQAQELAPSWGPQATSKVFDGTSWSDGPSFSMGFVGNMWHPETFAGEMVFHRLRGGAVGGSRISKFNGTRTAWAYTDEPFYDYTIAGDTLYALLTDGRILHTQDLARWRLLDVAPAEIEARSLGVLDDRLYVGATGGRLYRYSVPVPEPAHAGFIVVAATGVLLPRHRRALRPLA